MNIKENPLVSEDLTSQEKERYSRHILLKNLSLSGVKKIRQARVMVIGSGGLSNPLLTYLTVSGVGYLTLIDHDHVSNVNLARQFLFREEDLGKPKAEVAVKRLCSLNPGVEMEAIIEKVDQTNFERLAKKCDLVVETVDSIENKLSIHDLSLYYHKPLIHGGALAWEGQLLTILPGKSPCLRCFFPHLGIREKFQEFSNKRLKEFPWAKEGDSCSTEGVLSPLCGIVGSYQASEVLRFFTLPHEELHIGKMLRIDLSQNRHYYLYPQNKSCSCGVV